MQKHPNLSLIEHFKKLPDPRINRTKIMILIDVLIIALCSLLCAATSDMEEFGRAKQVSSKLFWNLRNDIPSHDTFNRVFAALDPESLIFLAWTQSVRQAVGKEIVAFWMARRCAAGHRRRW